MKRVTIALLGCLTLAFTADLAADEDQERDGTVILHEDNIDEEAEPAEEKQPKTVVMAWPVLYHESRRDHSQTNFLDVGLAKVYSRERNDNDTETEVGGVLWAELLKLNRGEDEAGIELVDLGLVELLEVSNRGERGHSVRFIDVPLVSVFESERHENFSENKFLNLPIFGSLFRNRTDGHKKEVELFYFITFKNYD